MAQFRLSIPSLGDTTDDTYRLNTFATQSDIIDVVVYKINSHGSSDTSTLTCEEDAIIATSGTPTMQITLTNSYEGVTIPILIKPQKSGPFYIPISIGVQHTVYIVGRRSLFSCPGELTFVGEAGVDNKIGFQLTNLDADSDLILNIGDTFTDASYIGIYHEQINAIEPHTSTALRITNGATLNLRFVIQNAQVQSSTFLITVLNALDAHDVLEIVCKIDIIDSLKLYGDSMVRRLFAEEVLSSSIRVGGAHVIFDEAAQKLRFMINDKEQSDNLSTSSAFVSDMIEHDATNPVSRLQILPSGELQLLHITNAAGVNSSSKKLHMDTDGKLRIHSGFIITPDFSKNDATEYSLHVNDDDTGNPILELRNGGEVKLTLGSK